MSEFSNLTRDDIVRKSLDISNEYARQGLRLTIRQLYYQFVARALFGSGQKNYKRIVGALTEARLNGDFPLDRIEDRGRDVSDGNFTRADGWMDRALDDKIPPVREVFEFESHELDHDFDDDGDEDLENDLDQDDDEIADGQIDDED